MTLRNSRPILMVEDNDTHFEAMLRALRQAGCDHPVFRCADGDEALDYLYRRGRYQVKNREGKKAIWTRIGSAWAHADGEGFNIQLDAVPIDGKVTLRVPAENVE